LERDIPRERVISVWGAVYREFKIDYEPYKSKKRQPEMFCEECYVRRAFWRVFRQEWARPVWAAPEGGYSLMPSSLGDRGDFLFCVLTAKGRLVAEQLKRQELILKFEKEDIVGRVVGQLLGLGFVYATVELVLDFLWGNCFEGFVNREEFDVYWNGEKLGYALRRCGVVRSRISGVDGRMKYCLASSVPFVDDAI
jgi:hypothetical protein